MNIHRGPWEIKDTHRIFKDDFIEVNVDEVTGGDHNERTYATVEMKPGVAVLAFNENDEVYLTKQFRYALNKESIEVVCGGIDKGMNPLDAARKELKEEIGLVADRWEDLGTVDIDTSIVHCPCRLYVARGLSKVGSDQEATEDIEPLKVPFDEAVAMVMRSEITHAPSCVVILRAFLKNESTKT